MGSALTRFWGRLSLTNRMILAIGLALVAVGMLFLVLVVRADINLERSQFSRKATDHLEFLKVGILEMAIVGDYSTIKEMLRARVADPTLDEITWVDTAGVKIVESKPEIVKDVPEWFVEWADIPSITEMTAIEVGGTTYGQIVISVSPKHSIERIYKRFVAGIEVGIAALIALFTLIAVITSKALRPLHSLEHAARQIAVGDYSARAPIAGSAEVRESIATFNNMADEIEHLLLQLRKVAIRMETIREEQNKRIASELHDSLGGNLIMLKLGLESILEDYPWSKRVETLTELTKTTIQLMRSLTSVLRPAMLDTLGLIPTLQWYAGEFSKLTGVKCSLELCRQSECTKEVDTAIFRVIQEALTNVARHAEATRAMIQLCEEEDHLVIEVADNGKGLPKDFDLNDPNRTSLGILGMRERTQYMNGDFSFSSTPDRGTTITVKIPLTNEVLAR